MITVFIRATNKHNLRDAVRSLINNAQSRNNYRIVIKGNGDWTEVISEFRESSDISVTIDGNAVPYEDDVIWYLSDDVFVLGYQWDKRILFYKDNYPDGIIVMFPSGYRPYGSKSENQVASLAERHPVLSRGWIDLVGMEDAEMICRTLFLKHGIDRRVDIRAVDIHERGAQKPNPEYSISEVEKKATIISDFISGISQT